MNGGNDGRWRLGSAPSWVAVAIVATLPISGCGSGDSPAEAQPTPKVTVVMRDGAYYPARVRIPVGARVTWFNRNEGAVTAETNGVGFFELDRDKLDRRNRFDIHTVQRGEAESVYFDTPGTYQYHSSYNTKMRGVVEVLARDPSG